MPQISRYQSCLAILSHFEKLLITLIDEFDLQRRHCNKVRFRQEAFEKRAYIRGIQMKLWTEQNISIFLHNPKVVAQPIAFSEDLPHKPCRPTSGSQYG